MTGTGGPLVGLRVIEFASIGPGPHCAMLLADQGADVVRIDREGGNGWPNPVVDRGRTVVTLDIRSDEGRGAALALCDEADVVIEGLRPGVMERLGLGPDEMLGRNPRLVYGRMTGWGQTGPMARTAGHDINYIALTGALDAIGTPGERSVPPLNLVGDFGGGSLYLAFGIMAALWERERSGQGQVVDAAIVDGVSSMMTMFAGLIPSGRITLDRARNPLGGSAPYYRTYLCADGREMSVGALEPQFWAEVVRILGIEADEPASLQREDRWPEAATLLETAFRSRGRNDWVERFRGSDACVAPVLTLEEAMRDTHLLTRGTYINDGSATFAAPAPRFSRTSRASCPESSD
ncbi:CaiB/BaiF CoA-transferase family protein [Sphingomonas sp. KR1UV-12]|uniref:CaiB/BaiF CoA-transferase family protein n=1 Tax=Sphingomonas aurea TaxID=3063994 RepID=A0ABT9EIT2_9SPHN|nr:CaiB/BaiF CoA-transferase family protein [Sphingomonas sp. KR1UV-12]MDP1026865.1 CaiB/BaiF CoA-transferase family protein [Sphingomonas sp. KR1UV-12]